MKLSEKLEKDDVAEWILKEIIILENKLKEKYEEEDRTSQAKGILINPFLIETKFEEVVAFPKNSIITVSANINDMADVSVADTEEMLDFMDAYSEGILLEDELYLDDLINETKPPYNSEEEEDDEGEKWKNES
jgi:hypothetical protein